MLNLGRSGQEGSIPRKTQKRVSISGFARSLRSEWRRLKLPASNERVVVAVSGGADSVALLLALDDLVASNKLGVRIVVAHLDHALRKESKSDALWVRDLARRLGHAFVTKRIDVKRWAARRGENLEQSARRARYAFLAEGAKQKRAVAIVTAHTMDDQAETLLLNLLRGAGMDGLAAIAPVRMFDAKSEIIIGRPLLSWASRRDTEEFCAQRGVEFCIDEMNADATLSRVRVRLQLLPLMQTFNPKVVAALTRTADLIREDAGALGAAADHLLRLAIDSSRNGHSRLQTDVLSLAPPALRRRALRQWIAECRGDLKRLERAHVFAVESLLSGEGGGRVIELPGGCTISRRQNWLTFAARRSRTK